MLKNINEHLGYLNQQVDIAPAGSEEELAAASYIEDVFKSHGIATSVQEFSAPCTVPALRAGTYIAVFVGVLLSGIPVAACKVIGTIILIAAIALLVADYMHKPVFEKIAPQTTSQNVIAHYEGQGQYAGRATRPIIIVSHYDTPHASKVVEKGLQSHLDLAIKVLIYSVPVVAVFAFIYLVLPLPNAAKIVFWILTLITALPSLGFGVVELMDYFGEYTEGANDNKSSLAAMFGIMDYLNNPNMVKTDEDEEFLQQQYIAEQEDLVEPSPVVEQIKGIRHGKNVIEALGILPATCEIEYVEPKIIEAAPEVQATDQINIPEPIIQEEEEQIVIPQAENIYEDIVPEQTSNLEIIEDNGFEEPVAEDTQDIDEDEEEALDCEYEVIEDEEEPVEVVDEQDTGQLDVQATQPMSIPQQDSIPTSVDTPQDPDATNPMQAIQAEDEQEDTPDNDSWGRTSYEPNMNKFAQRAALFDLPDPRVEDSMFDTNSSEPVVIEAPVNDEIDEPEEIENIFEPVEVIKPIDHVQKHAKKKHRLFGRKKKTSNEESMSEWLGVDESYDAKKDGRKIDSWDNFDDDSLDWKGGATTGSQFTVIDGAADSETSQQTPTDDDMREAILSMVEDEAEESLETEEFILDEKFLGHDIWFVALGASAADNAGMKAFLKEYRRNSRGAFLINLDSIGAGDLTLLAQEGAYNRRRVDRRVGRLLTSVAADLNIPLKKEPYLMKDTDATPAMRTSLRSATIMGVEDGVKALSGSEDDIIENVDIKQIDSVVDMVIELVRRS